jgi:hypothetical protein
VKNARLAGIAMSALLAMPHSVRAMETKLSLGAGGFATPWSEYQNSWISAQAKLSSEEKSDSSLSYSVSLLARSDSTLPLLGNVNELLYQTSKSLAWGRLAPRAETSLVSLDRSLNHRVCQTPFECALGGTVGAHYASEDGSLRLSLETLSLPNFSPTPKIDAGGRLSSSYRWSEVPYQFVDVSGTLVPLRITSAVDLSASTLVTPGLVFEKTFHLASGFDTTLVAATQRSKSPSSRSVDGLLVIDDPQQGLMAVANSEQRVSFPWQNILLAQSTIEISSSARAGFDLGAKFSRDDSFETGVFVESVVGPLVLRTRVGWHRQGDYEFLSIAPATRLRLGRATASLEAQLIAAESAQSLMLTPEIDYQLTRATSLFARGLLISADSGERLFTKFRGNDSVFLGVDYVF